MTIKVQVDSCTAEVLGRAGIQFAYSYDVAFAHNCYKTLWKRAGQDLDDTVPGMEQLNVSLHGAT